MPRPFPVLPRPRPCHLWMRPLIATKFVQTSVRVHHVSAARLSAWKSNLCWCSCGEAHGSGPSSFQPSAASLGRPDAGGLGHGTGRRGRRQLGGDKGDRRVAQCPALGSPTHRGAPQPCQSSRGRGSHVAASRRSGPRLSLCRASRSWEIQASIVKIIERRLDHPAKPHLTHEREAQRPIVRHSQLGEGPHFIPTGPLGCFRA
jgi:hypothetical protein